MHQLHRGAAPSCLQQHIRNSGNNWCKVSTTDKTEIWKELQAMQLDRCAYCESKISDPKRHIEHFCLRSLSPKLTFDWSNLFGSCNNKEHCGKHKDNQQHKSADLIKPDAEDPEKLLLFAFDGTVNIRSNLTPQEQHRAGETIRVFNLNTASLINQRKQAVQGYQSLVDDKSVLSEADWRQYFDFELQEAASQSFVTAIRHILLP
jgi:uncharacterized protein (TIGR02646 family)